MFFLAKRKASQLCTRYLIPNDSSISYSPLQSPSLAELTTFLTSWDTNESLIISSVETMTDLLEISVVGISRSQEYYEMKQMYSSVQIEFAFKLGNM